MRGWLARYVGEPSSKPDSNSDMAKFISRWGEFIFQTASVLNFTIITSLQEGNEQPNPIQGWPKVCTHSDETSMARFT